METVTKHPLVDMLNRHGIINADLMEKISADDEGSYEVKVYHPSKFEYFDILSIFKTDAGILAFTGYDSLILDKNNILVSKTN